MRKSTERKSWSANEHNNDPAAAQAINNLSIEVIGQQKELDAYRQILDAILFYLVRTSNESAKSIVDKILRQRHVDPDVKTLVAKTVTLIDGLFNPEENA